MSSLAVLLLLLLLAAPSYAQTRQPALADGLVDTTLHETLGQKMAEGTETRTIFSPTAETDRYANGVVITAFKGVLYCMWQSSKTDEDAPETSILYSFSKDEGNSWTKPQLLAAATDSTYCTSGGWIATTDTLVAFINSWPKTLQPRGGYTLYIKSTDGLRWSDPLSVLMADGKPMNGIIEQDPCSLPSGRIIGAAHFQPGLHVCPIYTDNPLGISGWKRAAFSSHDRGNQSQELEPSQYRLRDGRLVMVFRDQKSSFRKLAAVSENQGESWTSATVTNIPDARVKQSAGNLPDGRAYFVGTPTGCKRRSPLVVLFSNDGLLFTEGYLLRAGGSDLQPQRYPGKYKTLGYSYPKSLVYNGKLYVAYATNKEDVECTWMPLSE